MLDNRRRVARWRPASSCQSGSRVSRHRSQGSFRLVGWRHHCPGNQLCQASRMLSQVGWAWSPTLCLEVLCHRGQSSLNQIHSVIRMDCRVPPWPLYQIPACHWVGHNQRRPAAVGSRCHHRRRSVRARRSLSQLVQGRRYQEGPSWNRRRPLNRLAPGRRLLAIRRARADWRFVGVRR